MTRALLCLALLLTPAAAVAGSLEPLRDLQSRWLIQVGTSTSTSTSVGCASGQILNATSGTGTTTLALWSSPPWAAPIDHVHPIAIGSGSGRSEEPATWPLWVILSLGGVMAAGNVGGRVLDWNDQRHRAIASSRSAWSCRVCGAQGSTTRSLAAEEVDHMLATGCRGDLAEEHRRIQ